MSPDQSTSRCGAVIFGIAGVAAALCWNCRIETMAADGSDASSSRPFASGTEGYHTFRIPAVVVTNKGTLLALCEEHKSQSGDTGDIDMVAKRSLDNGRTWQPLQLIWDDGPNTCGNPCPVVDRTNGVIWLLMSHNLGKDDELPLCRRTAEGTRTAWVSKSDDDGVTWSKPREITATAKKPEWGYFATGPGVAIQLQRPPHSGRLVVPCNYTVQPDADRLEQFEWGSHAILSDDHGETWRLGGVIPGLKVDECQVVELADGSLLMNMRSHQHGCRGLSLSKDGGESWSEVWHDKTLIDPDCQGSILHYSDAKTGRSLLVFSNAASSKSRNHMTVRLSYDEGKSWPAARLLYGGPAAYSCLTVLPDGMIGCLYESGRKNPYESLTFVRFRLEWLADGREAVEERIGPPPTERY